MESDKLVIIDTDAGIDDATAILLCTQAHDKKEIPIKIIAITCSSGNTKVENVVHNVTRTLAIANHNEIPIFKGASNPIVFPCDFLLNWNGVDGFGDVADLPEIQPKVEAEHAVNAIVRLVHENPGKVTILALGPLTNLALAIRMDPTIADELKEIYLMGGNVKGAGNDTICAEFNFAFDPEAAHIVLSSYKCPIYIIPLEVGRDKVIQKFDWREKELRDTMDTPYSRFINKLEAFNLENKHKPLGKWTSHDTAAAVAMIAPDAIKKVLNHHCLVELHGNHTRGQLIVDFLPHYHPAKNVHIITDMDNEIFQKMLKWAFGGPCPI